MSDPTDSPPTSAAIHGPLWAERAEDWARLCAGLSAPAWDVVAEATGIAEGTRVLDVGCGSGEFCRLAAARGARVSGIDAAEGMLQIARRLAPHADLRVGAMETLPWDDESFDVVTAFNSLHFAAEFGVALAEAARVVCRGGLLAVCNWAHAEAVELFAVMAPLRALRPPPPADRPPPSPPATGEPGVLEELLRGVGLEPVRAGELDVPFEAPNRDTLERALLASGGAAAAIEHSGERAVLETIAEAAAPFRRADGSYRFENRYRYVIAERPLGGEG